MKDTQEFQKTISLPPLFNNANLLQFDIEPDKRCFRLRDSYLQFYVELEDDFVPDNNFCSKLFEYMDLNINYEDVSFKCSSNDYDFTTFVQQRINISDKLSKRIPFEGNFDYFNYDSSELKNNASVVQMRQCGSKFTKDGTNYIRYHFMTPIYHGLSHGQILPAGVHISLTFHRAKAEKALVDISNTVVEFPSKTIPILDPILHTEWAYGEVITQQMSQIKRNGISIPFTASHIRHRKLQTGLKTEQKIEILQGPLPQYVVFFLMKPDRFGGDLKLSSTKMEMHNLEKFTLKIDDVQMENYPLNVTKYGSSKFYHEFYRHFLMQTGIYEDQDQNFMKEDTYVNGNFMILESFENSQVKEGHLSVSLIFGDELKEELFLCWMPCYEKQLKFDKYLSVQMV